MNNIKILSIKDISVEAYQLYLSLASPFKKEGLLDIEIRTIN